MYAFVKGGFSNYTLTLLDCTTMDIFHLFSFVCVHYFVQFIVPSEGRRDS
jgi:hypothetical protein